jgi:DNA-binding PadR family transcriptional regulator
LEKAMATTEPRQDAPALTPAMHHILLALLEGDRHGYAIMQAVDTLSHGQMRLGPGTLYASIKKLLDGRLIEESAQRPDADDERRRYYRLSSSGREAVFAETRRLSRLVQYAHKHARGLLLA